ncbi:hypothetical protein [Inquilinus sp. CAU 1745]|uniref:hypothetical protein n=1 Tax=Inquilinus sp. CAU 1745 TaxID=3140369 RepID=UPI00325ACA14
MGMGLFSGMKTYSLITVVALIASTGCAVAQTESFPVIQTETAFLEACEQEWVQRAPAAAPWARGECQVKWGWAMAAGPMAETILAMSVADDDTARAQAQVPAPGAVMPAGVAVSHTATGIRFDWQEQGSEGRYNVTDALRSRGVALRSLGCPQYPGASMGREKVMLATLPGRQPFVVAVYSRAAPTGREYAAYEVDADFSGVVPDMPALRAGRYPGGGGRAFAVDPTGWVAECPDPERS